MGITAGLVGLISKMAKSPKLYPSGARALTAIRSKGLAIKTNTFYQQWRTANNLIVGQKYLQSLPITTMLRKSMLPKASGKLANNYLVFMDVKYYNRISKSFLTRTISVYTNRLKRIDSLILDAGNLWGIYRTHQPLMHGDVESITFKSAVRKN